MDRLRKVQENWEGFAQTDPLWAICADPRKKYNRWSREEFFATGRDEIERVLDCVQSLGLRLDWKSPALDFGCGVGRLTRALAGRFAECWGVDISSTMIERAKEFNRDIPHCHFLLNEQERLENFQDDYFGFIYSSIVLQHLPEEYAKSYLAELIRVLRPGSVLVFQVTDQYRAGMVLRVRQMVALRSRLRRLFGKPVDKFVMEMHCHPEADIRQFLQEHQARVVDVRLTNSADPAFNGNLRYLDQEPAQGFVSKQYCVIKNGPRLNGQAHIVGAAGGQGA